MISKKYIYQDALNDLQVRILLSVGLRQVGKTLAALVALAFFNCISPVQTAIADQPNSTSVAVEIGAIISLSGELAPFGQGIQQGVELARAEGRANLISFVYEDDQSLNQRALVVSALQRLLQRKIKIIAMFGMPHVAIADQIVSSRGVVALSLLDSNDRIQKLSANIFGFGWSNEGTAKRSADLAIRELKARTAVIVAGHEEWSEIMGSAFAREFKDKGGAVANYSSIDLNATDFRSLVTKLVQLKPDVVYFPLYGPALLSFAKQLKQAGYAGTMMSAEAMTDVEVKALGGAAEGMWATGAYLADSDFERRYKKHFRLDQIVLNLAHVALGYDLALMLNAAVEKMHAEQRPFDDANLREVIGSSTINGVMGSTSFVDRVVTGRVQHLFVVRDGKLVPWG